MDFRVSMGFIAGFFCAMAFFQLILTRAALYFAPDLRIISVFVVLYVGTIILSLATLYMSPPYVWQALLALAVIYLGLSLRNIMNPQWTHILLMALVIVYLFFVRKKVFTSPTA